MLVVEAANNERKGFSHRGDVGGDVESVRGDQQEDQGQHQPAGRQLHDVGGKSLPGHSADTRTHQLDRDHEWRREKHRPKQAVTELRSGLRIGRNARRIVIGGAGH